MFMAELVKRKITETIGLSIFVLNTPAKAIIVGEMMMEMRVEQERQVGNRKKIRLTPVRRKMKI